MDPLLIVVLACTGATLLKDRFGGEKRAPDHGVLTPQRQAVFKAMMRAQKSPETFEAAAREFEAHGLKAQADLLRARANSQRLTPEQQEARKKVVAKVFQSTDSAQIRRAADVFEGQGLTRLAERMRAHARNVDAKRVVLPEPAKAG